ncbi:short-chain dehydrogenase [Naasia aerilata]|uniref:Short-chain dehydrogenase n=1 Tax=Naasia aerilata TaxID=1162966 RepID=A0ABN6XH62_9MICO|nr:short-chain dehydrogenase [Naasia aerilata]
MTGAAGGIGSAIVGRLLEAGHSVAATDLSGLAELDGLAERFAERLTRTELDVCSAAAVRGFVASFEEDGAAIGALVTVAGIQKTGASETYELDDWRRVLEVNLTGTWVPIQAVLGPLLARGAGRILTVSSEIGLSGAPYYAAYAASKGGVIALTKSLAKEYAGRGLVVNSIAPGPIETGIFLGERGHNQAWLDANVPAGRFGSPDDVAEAVAFLLSGKADYFVGQVLSPNGGVVI